MKEGVGVETVYESGAEKHGEFSRRLRRQQEDAAWLVRGAPTCASSGLSQTLSGSTQSEILFFQPSFLSLGFFPAPF